MPKTAPQGQPYGWETLLGIAGLATVAMLKRHRRRPGEGQQPVGYYWSGHDNVLLYRVADAVAMPALSPGRQRLYAQARTCAECGATGLDPFEKGRDGRRYCQPCQGPVHERLWQQERAEDRWVVAAWARGVLADPTVVLVGAAHRGYWREVHVEDLASGSVLLAAKVRHSALVLEPEHPALAEGAVSPADLGAQAARLAERRLVAWWRSTDLLLYRDSTEHGHPDRAGRVVRTAEQDHLGQWYERWVGQLAPGTSYRYHPALARQAPPREPAEQVARMRQLLVEMAAGPPTGEPPAAGGGRA